MVGMEQHYPREQYLNVLGLDLAYQSFASGLLGQPMGNLGTKATYDGIECLRVDEEDTSWLIMYEGDDIFCLGVYKYSTVSAEEIFATVKCIR